MKKSSKVLWLTIFTYLNCVQCHEIFDDFLELSDESSKIHLNKECSDHLRLIKSGIESKEVWALKVQDASGKSTAGFTWGNNFWLGRETSCYLLNNPPKISLVKSANRKMLANLTDIASMVAVEYRMFYAGHQSTLQFDADLFDKSILHVGLCFPKSCNGSSAQEMAVTVFQKKYRNELVYGDMKYLATKTLNIRHNFLNEPFVVWLLALAVTFTFLAIAGTVFKCLNSKSKFQNCLPSSNEMKMKLKITGAMKFWECFSLTDNCRFIMSTKLSKKSIAPIHGVRALGAFWIFAGHVYYYAFGPTDNLQLIFAYADSLLLQPLFSAAISVDSFYVMSGFLLSYLFYEKQKKRPSKQLCVDVVKGIIYRYIRIAPCFMIVMLIAGTLSIFINDTSQFIAIEDIETNCKNYWWRNLLFIQNFYPLNEMCMSWSWYVATDFQLFALSSVLLAISAKNMRLSVIFALALVALSSAYSGYVGVRESFGFSLDSQFRSLDTLYTKPYTRVGGYFAGVWTGFYLSKINRQWSIRKITLNSLRVVSIAIVIFMIYIQRYRVTENFWVASLFPALGRILWSLPICFMIIDGSAEHRHGLVSRILNSKVLLPFSRMTFAAYLLNPLVVMLVTMSCETSFRLDFYTIGIITLGFYIATYFAAFIFMILFENPIIMFIKKFAE